MTKRVKVKILLLPFFLTISLLINILLVFWYFDRIKPTILSLKGELVSCTEKPQSSQQSRNNELCKKTYHFPGQKGTKVCVKEGDSRSEVLSMCSENFALYYGVKPLERLDEIDEYKKFRDLMVEMCMQEMGYEY